MDRNTSYFNQVSLLVRILPMVAQEECFALKGGTAINLFIRDLPRLSVDIDLVYLPLDPREEALPEIDNALDRIRARIMSSFPNARIQVTDPQQTNSKRLTVRYDDTQIKVELSPVLRGTVWPTEAREVTEKVEKVFGYAEIAMVSLNDLYAGKICAALDRQHPRDLYDIKLLFENEGINRDLFKTFLVYLISHGRPMYELLSPSIKDISTLFENEFVGMTEEDVTLDELLNTREKLISHIHHAITNQDREFLISVKERTPDWSLLDLEGVADLPAVKWKIINLNRMNDDKHAEAVKRLKKFLAEIRIL